MTGTELTALRRRVGLSQAALARRIGVSRQTISYWEGKPALDGRSTILERISEYLNSEDAHRLRSSRPGLGFVRLHFLGSVSRHQMKIVSDAMAIRRITLASIAQRPCKAMTRAGTPCRLQSEPGKQRCRLHGGLSTGPRTAEGKARIAAAQRRRWQKRRDKERVL
ncbi:helix-turn-helix domain-containing protein [Paracoccus tegillarcae]